MKLDEKLKERIDKYFNEISAEELYYILTEKYKFPENSDQTVSVNCDKYLRKEDNTSDFFNNIISYANLEIMQKIEIIKMKYIDDISNNPNEGIKCDKSCSIPLAA